MIRRFIHSLILKERDTSLLAASCALGIFLAFSPFIGLHTILAIILSWSLSLNFFVVFAVSHFVNNPWTMVPVYSLGYCVGEWVLGGIFGIDTIANNPTWMAYLNELLHSYTGLHSISWWSFILGGNLLGLAIAAMLYPIMKHFFSRLIPSKQ